MGGINIKQQTESDVFKVQLEERLDPAVVRKLSRVNPLLGLGHITFEWTCILCVIWLCQTFWHPLLFVVGILVIGARQHALAITMQDGSHYRLLTNKFWNDVIGNLFLAFPIFLTVDNYRKTHFTHHRSPNTEDDPDWVAKDSADWEFPKNRNQTFLMHVRIGLGLNTLFIVRLVMSGGDRGKLAPQLRRSWATRISVYITAAVLLTYFQLWGAYLLYWILPMFTWLQLILRVRSIGDHFRFELDQVYTQARTTYLSWFERIFLVSKNLWFHLDYHLYPSVRFDRLPQLHRELLKLPMFHEKVPITNSYLGVLLEYMNGKTTS